MHRLNWGPKWFVRSKARTLQTNNKIPCLFCFKISAITVSIPLFRTLFAASDMIYHISLEYSSHIPTPPFWHHISIHAIYFIYTWTVPPGHLETSPFSNRTNEECRRCPKRVENRRPIAATNRAGGKPTRPSPWRCRHGWGSSQRKQLGSCRLKIGYNEMYIYCRLFRSWLHMYMYKYIYQKNVYTPYDVSTWVLASL